MYFAEDENFARRLQDEFNCMQNFKLQNETKEKENYNLINSHLELSDPTPSIHDLFVKFDKKFFWGSLGMVEVLWSKRMTKCAGMCSFQSRGRICKISLSAPLLSLRPRKDLVETLLHEMIHAYLFVTNNHRDRDDHGPEFHKHMYRINHEAGTKITVYHTFHDEVEYYLTHIWRCNGPCRTKKPYFGFVRRSINRAPGPYDRWWQQHQLECGGTYIKIAEPEKKTKKNNKVKGSDSGKKLKDIKDFFNSGKSPKSVFGVGINNNNNNNNNNKISNIRTLADLVVNTKMGGVKANTNTGTLVITDSKKKPQPNKEDSENSKRNKNPTKKKPTDDTNKEFLLSDYFKKLPKTNKEENSVQSKNSISNKTPNKIKKIEDTKTSKAKDSSEEGKEISSEKIRETVRNVWANKFASKSVTEINQTPKKLKVQCPICEEGFSEEEIQFHIDDCLDSKPGKVNLETVSEKVEVTKAESSKESEELKMCPVCSEKILQSEMNDHLENCLQCSFVNENEYDVENEVKCQSVPCPCCYKWFLESEMNSHIDDCLTLNALKEELLGC